MFAANYIGAEDMKSQVENINDETVEGSKNDIILQLVNEALKDLLPVVNPIIDQEIKSQNLDPWQNVAGGTASPGQYCYDFPWPVGNECVGASASWSVTNFKGLSALKIQKFTAISLQKTGGNDEFSADVNLIVSSASSLQGSVSGSVGAKVAFIHPTVSIGGNVTVNSPVANDTGTITVSYKDGKICISKISLSAPTVHTGDISVSVNGLGVFDFLLDGVVNVIVNGFKSQLLGLLSSQLTPLLNREINSQMPFPK